MSQLRFQQRRSTARHTLQLIAVAACAVGLVVGDEGVAGAAGEPQDKARDCGQRQDGQDCQDFFQGRSSRTIFFRAYPVMHECAWANRAAVSLPAATSAEPVMSFSY